LLSQRKDFCNHRFDVVASSLSMFRSVPVLKAAAFSRCRCDDVGGTATTFAVVKGLEHEWQLIMLIAEVRICYGCRCCCRWDEAQYDWRKATCDSIAAAFQPTS